MSSIFHGAVNAVSGSAASFLTLSVTVDTHATEYSVGEPELSTGTSTTVKVNLTFAPITDDGMNSRLVHVPIMNDPVTDVVTSAYCNWYARVLLVVVFITR